ncbi:MAG: hypothetical protein KUL75_07020 [Sterolibacterium sp.]|nr:hypothetical protein [Sterolibacterium sp.]
MKPLNSGSYPHRESGAVAVMVALLLVVLFGFAALAIDVGNAYLVRGQMQNAADAAAHAGANGLARGMAIDAAKDEAKDYAEKNGFKDGSGSAVVTISIPPGGSESYATNDQYVRAVITRPTSLILGQILGANAWQIRAEAVAGVTGNTGYPDCLTLTNGITTNGNAYDITLDGCSASIGAAGGVANNGKGNFVLNNDAKINIYNNGTNTACPGKTWCSKVQTHAEPMIAPQAPSYTDDIDALKNQTPTTCSGSTCSPGRYSTFSYTGNTSLSLSAGHYWFDNGIELKGGASIQGTSVTIHLPSGKNISTSGSAQLKISGPTTDGCPEGGVVIHYHGSGSSVNDLIGGNGGQLVEIKGIVYAPQAELAFGGNPKPKFYGSVIANSIKLNGNVHAEFSGNPCQHHYTNSGPGQVAIYE